MGESTDDQAGRRSGIPWPGGSSGFYRRCPECDGGRLVEGVACPTCCYEGYVPVDAVDQRSVSVTPQTEEK